MRFFRIPSFTGIEAHRDDNDRGSLRVVEGCMPRGMGGVRSGPVWNQLAKLNAISQDNKNFLSANDDGAGNSVLFVSRNKEIHDLAISSESNTEIVSLGASYQVVDPISIYSTSKAILSAIGNRMYAFGDGSGDPIFLGKGAPDMEHYIYPDEEIYSQEYERFPNCTFFVQGGNKMLYGAGNPEEPLTVYVTEPAGITNPLKDSIYSEALSSIRILSSDASKITALSSKGPNVIVHTDKGSHVLSPAEADQDNSGYRVKQTPVTNFSSAVNHQVVAGEKGSQTYWLGNDGQIYKDELPNAGQENSETSADQTQPAYKSKGAWEGEQIDDLRNSFSAYNAQTGMYWVYIENEIQQ